MNRKASRERGERDEGEGGGGVVGRPAVERKGPLLRLDCFLSGDSGSCSFGQNMVEAGSKATFTLESGVIEPTSEVPAELFPRPVPAEVNWH